MSRYDKSVITVLNRLLTHSCCALVLAAFCLQGALESLLRELPYPAAFPAAAVLLDSFLNVPSVLLHWLVFGDLKASSMSPAVSEVAGAGFAARPVHTRAANRCPIGATVLQMSEFLCTNASQVSSTRAAASTASCVFLLDQCHAWHH